MRVAASPFPFVETPQPPQQAKGGGDYGRGFESAIRTAETNGAEAEPVAHREPDATPDKPHAPSRETASAQKEKATEEKAPKDAKSSSEAGDFTETKDDDSVRNGAETAPATATSSADDILSRLLSGALTTASANTTVSTGENGSNADQSETLDMLAAETVLEERIVVISLEAGASEPATDAAAGARSTVKLEVVHMETHFEPRSDAFVLVDKQVNSTRGKATAASQDAKAGMDRAAAESATPKLRFDEALARLSGREAGTETEFSGERRRGEAAEDKAAQRSTRKDFERIETRSSMAAAAVAKDEDGAALTQPLASMTGQVAGRVIDALGPTLAGQRSAETPQSDTYLKMTAGGAALKTLTIQLQPEHLGRLDVSMRLVEGQLTLEIAATEASTAKVLAEDRDGLRKLLQHAGFSLDDTAITIVSRDAQAHGRVASLSESATAQQDGAGSRNSGASPERDPRQPPQDGGREGGRRQAPGDRPKPGTRSSATYV